MHAHGQKVLDDLLAGNQRFRAGKPKTYAYSQAELKALAAQQKPIAAIVACSDSRIAPEIVFDQPLGAIFASRVPGNVASDSAKWMLELALGDFHVPLVMVMGHTGCLAVGSLLDGDKGGAGGLHRFSVLSSVYRAKQRNPADLHLAAVEENVLQTVEHLARDLYPLRKALLAEETSIVGSVYEMETGLVRPIPTAVELYGVF